MVSSVFWASKRKNRTCYSESRSRNWSAEICCSGRHSSSTLARLGVGSGATCSPRRSSCPGGACLGNTRQSLHHLRLGLLALGYERAKVSVRRGQGVGLWVGWTHSRLGCTLWLVSTPEEWNVFVSRLTKRVLGQWTVSSTGHVVNVRLLPLPLRKTTRHYLHRNCFVRMEFPKSASFNFAVQIGRLSQTWLGCGQSWHGWTGLSHSGFHGRLGQRSVCSRSWILNACSMLSWGLGLLGATLLWARRWLTHQSGSSCQP